MKRNIIIIGLALIVLAIGIVSYFTDNSIEPVSKSEYYLNTFCTVTIYDMEKMSTENAETIIVDSFALCEDYEKKFSRTIADSDVSKINESQGAAVDVDIEVAKMIEDSQEISALTGGTFDITIGAVSDLWDFQSSEPTLPNDVAIKDALTTIGYQNINVQSGQVILTNSDTKIDLGGIAKGYIADKIAEFLFEQNVTSAIVNFGGNVVTLGEKSEGEAFVIGVERPFSENTLGTDEEDDANSGIIGSIELSDQTVVVSGIYQRNFVLDGVLYHHILDPETGYPIETELEAVAVIGPRGESMMCDALSTAFLMLGEKESERILEGMEEFSAIFIYPNGEYYASGVEVYN